jgi:predicted amidohydrolase YtcJ
MDPSTSPELRARSSISLLDVELEGRRADVLIVGDRVAAIEHGRDDRGEATFSADLPTPESVLRANGGALIPGLHDHHVHLLSMAARAHSFDLGSCQLEHLDLSERIAALGQAVPTNTPEWLRVTGYQESMGPLDAGVLDRLELNRPVRVQHRSGALWVLNTQAAALVDLAGVRQEGVERDRDGRITGRLFGLDRWLGAVIAPEPVDLYQVATQLHSYGVTGVTDLTPVSDAIQLLPLHEAARGGLPLRIVVSPAPGVSPPHGQWFPLLLGPVKVYLADHDLPTFDQVSQAFRAAHESGRPVAVHSVSRASLALAMAAWHDVGTVAGDRLEHGSLISSEAMHVLASLGVAVVTQPNFIGERGDDYLRDVPPTDLIDLYRCQSLTEAGIPVSIGTDLPFGHPDPWAAISAATTRRTRSGKTIGRAEAISAERALSMFLAEPSAPAGPPRRISVGSVADLCLLNRPLTAVLSKPTSDAVQATLVAGEIVLCKSQSRAGLSPEHPLRAVG